jgi:hypothetical protein
MFKSDIKKNWLIWLSCAALIFIQTNPASAILSEPEILIYGQIFNQYQNNKILVTDAQIKWKIRKKGSDKIHTYQGAVECLKCQEYDTEGLNCIACEKYAYVIKIPQETSPVQETANESTLALFADNQQYDLLEVSVNDIPANMNIKSQLGNISPDDKEGKFILAG